MASPRRVLAGKEGGFSTMWRCGEFWLTAILGKTRHVPRRYRSVAFGRRAIRDSGDSSTCDVEVI